MCPIDVNKSNELKLLLNAYNFIKLATSSHTFSISDTVRISKVKHLFDKKYTPNWTTELFKIAKVNITHPRTYQIEDLHGHPIRGAFYEPELQKTNQHDVYLVEKVLRKRGNNVYVKWLGFDNFVIDKHSL